MAWPLSVGLAHFGMVPGDIEIEVTEMDSKRTAGYFGDSSRENEPGLRGGRRR